MNTDPEHGKIFLDVILNEIEKSFLLEALAKCQGIKKNAAKHLNISFRSFRYRLEKHNIAQESNESEL